MRWAVVFIGFALCQVLASGQFQLRPPPFVPDKVEGLKLEIVPDQPSYELGMQVTATLRYTYTGSQPFVVHFPLNDIDRMEGLSFVGKSPDGGPMLDPLPYWMSISPGQHFGAIELGPKEPHDEKVVLNQWLLFDQPGRYTVTAQSTLAALNEFHVERERGEARSVNLQSEPLVITITPAVEAHRVQALAQAATDLTNPNHHLHWPAIKRLRYLRDSRSIPLLLSGLVDEEDGPINFEACAGLYILPDQQQVKTALLKFIDGLVEPPPPYAQWVTADLLAHADGGNEETWGKMLTEKISKKAMTNADHVSPAETEKRLIKEYNSGGDPLPPTLDEKRFILDNAQYLDDSANEGYAPGVIQNLCRDPELVPDLKAVVANPKVRPDIRSAAVVALHHLGHDDFRDGIVKDLMSPKPVLSDDVHALIGNYRAAEIGRALLSLLENEDWQVAESAANRMPAFGGAISADDLNRVLVRMANAHQLHDSQCFRAVYALAMKSPKRAVALIQRIANVEGEYNTLHDPILCRVKEGRPLVLKVLHAGDDFHRTAMLKEFQQVVWEKQTEAARNADKAHRNWPDEIYDDYSFRLPPDTKLVVSYMPEFIRLAKTEPNNEVRLAAVDVLASLSGIPGDPAAWKIHTEDVATLLPQWEKWYEQHVGDS